jgi:hypothetical protein
MHLLPLLLLTGASWGFMEYMTAGVDGLERRAHLNNRTVMNKRLQVLEEGLGLTRVGARGDELQGMPAKGASGGGGGGGSGGGNAEAQPTSAARALWLQLTSALGVPPSYSPERHRVNTPNTAMSAPFEAELQKLREARAAGNPLPLQVLVQEQQTTRAPGAAGAPPPPPLTLPASAAAVEALERRIQELEALVAAADSKRGRGMGGEGGGVTGAPAAVAAAGAGEVAAEGARAAEASTEREAGAPVAPSAVAESRAAAG